MQIVKFDGCNITYGKDQPEYLPLPACKTEEGDVTSCWKMNLKERLRVLFTGRVYVSLLTFNRPLQPQRVSVHKPIQEITTNAK